MKYFFSAFCIVLSLCTYVHAEMWTSHNIPDPKQFSNANWVSNPDKILSNSEVIKINNQISQLNGEHNLQAGVVIVKSLGEDIESFANKTYNKWGIGGSQTDRGLLLVVAVEQKIQRFEIGYGLEGDLPDVVVFRILDQQMVPLNKQGLFADSISVGLQSISSALKGEKSSQLPQNLNTSNKDAVLQKGTAKSSDKNEKYTFWILLVFIFSFYLIIARVNGLKTKGYILTIVFLPLIVGFFYLIIYAFDRGLPATQTLFFAWSATAAVFNLFILTSFAGFKRKIITEFKSRDDQYNQLFYYLNEIMQLQLTLGFPFSLSVTKKIKDLGKELREANLGCDCGNVMKFKNNVLSQSEELKLKSEYQNKEEEIGASDYDVWLCNKCQKTKIYRYLSKDISYSECEKCRLFGMKTRDEIIRQPVYGRDGLKYIHYECVICKFHRKEESIIPYTDSSSGGSGGGGGGSSWGGGSSGGGGATGRW